jgi:hypothetical protein
MHGWHILALKLLDSLELSPPVKQVVVEALVKIAAKLDNAPVSAAPRVTTATISDIGRGVGGHKVMDRLAGEIQGAVNQAERVLSVGGTGGTRWGAIYQRYNGTGHWLESVSRGNAIQQIAETRLLNNTYFQEAGVIFNKGHVLGLRSSSGSLLRPDFQVPLSGGRVGVLDITTQGQAGKIFKYSVRGSNQVPILINVTY